ncbi:MULTISPECIES: acyl-CoA dehydrogenase family protein [Burkholderia]|uniref:acyl-CoA dehydrogenase family protein n=1 Tax=Burkholderia TaxID=32008 RepID=UPI0008416D56|nr:MULTISPECIES: acyl-CoA dehydrogenase family protein [unclassified Burkholderia]AOK29700.1 pimeloyl-CoA dehydrogenase small subunit [Burkholderia sp. Bp7605]
MNCDNSAFELTETQAMLRDSLERFLTEQYDIELRARTLAAAEDQPPLWRAFAHKLGLFGASFSEAQGGLGGDMRDNLVIMETLGRHLAAEPYLSTVVIGGGLLRRVPGAQAHSLLGRVIDGDAVIAFAATEPQGRYDLADIQTRLKPVGGGWLLSGRKAVVHSAPWATELLITARSAGAPYDPLGVSLLCLPADVPGISRRVYRTLDGGRASELVFNEVPVRADQLLGEPGAALPLLEQVLDEATLAVCAEACGVLSRLLHDTVDYAKQRRQFGVPIASFQVLQHRMADMYMALEQVRALTAASVAALDAPPAERMSAVSSAKVCVNRACRIVGQGAVQIHGGMGMTEELAVGHYFRRATQIEQLFGSLEHHLRRVDRVAQAFDA